MFLTIVKLILAVLNFIFLPLIFLLLTPIYLIRYVIGKSSQYLDPNAGKMLTASATILAVDDMDQPKVTVIVNLIVKGISTFEDFKARFNERVIQAKNSDGKLCKPEFQQYVSKRLGFLFWKWDEKFKLENHIHQDPGEVRYDVLNEEAMCQIMKSLVYKPYPIKRSPWEVIFLDNYQDDRNSGDGEPCAVIIIRVHHSLADGFSILKCLVLDVFSSDKLNIPGSSHIAGRVKPSSVSETILKCIKPMYIPLRIPYDVATFVIDNLRFNSNAWHVPESQLTRTMNSAYSSKISIQDVKDVKNACQCSFPTVVLAAYAGALRKFMSEAGYQVPTEILGGFPLPMPNHPEHKLRNHATAVLVRIPTGLPSSLQRLKTIEKNLAKSKTGAFPLLSYYSGICMGSLFAWMTKQGTVNKTTTAICSIFPAPNSEVSGGGFTALETGYGGGFMRGNTGLGFSCLGYNGKLVIIVGVDEGLVPESKLPASKLIDYMIEELQELKNGQVIQDV